MARNPVITVQDQAVESDEELDEQPPVDQIWKRILRPNGARDPKVQEALYNWVRPASFRCLEGPQFWTSQYFKAAYPKLGWFLEKNTNVPEKKVEIQIEDTELTSNSNIVKKTYNDRYDLLLWHGRDEGKMTHLFNALRDLPTKHLTAKEGPLQSRSGAHRTRLTRTMHVSNVSPKVIKCMFGTASKWDRSTIAAYVERYLLGKNFGKVNLHRSVSHGWSSYVFEYHFSFYYVPLDYTDPKRVRIDYRDVRRTSRFGQERAGKHRHIHEQTASFLLIGRFDDLCTSLQLSESYFKPPFDVDGTFLVSFRSHNPNKSPAELFLDWLHINSFQARSRWSTAIKALQAAITSPDGVVFSDDRSELMADDCQFTLSKTYFWALQTYKLFESALEPTAAVLMRRGEQYRPGFSSLEMIIEASMPRMSGLQETITAWELFKKDSLPKLKDGRIKDQDFDRAVLDIDGSISELKSKLDQVKRGIQDVRDLREGLQSTAAVFDSRTAVRQGANIRVLTFITILFLPLTFGVAIFGMQIIPGTPAAIKAFAITIAALSIVTFSVIANLDIVSHVWTFLSRTFTDHLLDGMSVEGRKIWKQRALALREDRAINEPPVKVTLRKSTHWVYALYLLEKLLVVVPVKEIQQALRLYGLFAKSSDDDDQILENGDDASVNDNESVDEEQQFRETIRRENTENYYSNLFLSRNEKKARIKEAIARVKTQAHVDGKDPQIMAMIEKVTAEMYPSRLRVCAQALFNILRFLLLPVWISLLTIEYFTLWLVYATMDLLDRAHQHLFHPSRVELHRRISKGPAPVKKPVSSPGSRAWNILRLDLVAWLRVNRQRRKLKDDEATLRVKGAKSRLGNLNLVQQVQITGIPESALGSTITQPSRTLQSPKPEIQRKVTKRWQNQMEKKKRRPSLSLSSLPKTDFNPLRGRRSSRSGALSPPLSPKNVDRDLSPLRPALRRLNSRISEEVAVDDQSHPGSNGATSSSKGVATQDFVNPFFPDPSTPPQERQNLDMQNTSPGAKDD